MGRDTSTRPGCPDPHPTWPYQLVLFLLQLTERLWTALKNWAGKWETFIGMNGSGKMESPPLRVCSVFLLTDGWALASRCAGVEPGEGWRQALGLLRAAPAALLPSWWHGELGAQCMPKALSFQIGNGQVSEQCLCRGKANSNKGKHVCDRSVNHCHQNQLFTMWHHCWVHEDAEHLLGDIRS